MQTIIHVDGKYIQLDCGHVYTGKNAQPGDPHRCLECERIGLYGFDVREEAE